MISVEHLTKRYRSHVAVNDVSFEVQKGEVVGFLGPNGAGKSTTMRILSGYVPATGGKVEVAGFNVRTEGLEVRKRIGYLPESCPLYEEMRVKEYLRFRASLKGVAGRHRRRRVETVMDQCSLGPMRNKLIGQLSKGYRQRVGIADSLVHSPDLLILDEPTIGLDPHQIRQVRSLIRLLAEQHTILLSTHILSEVEATCDRVLILNRGRIVESAPLDLLYQKWANDCVVHLEVKADEAQIRTLLTGLKGLHALEIDEMKMGWMHVTCAFSKRTDPRDELGGAVTRAGWPLRELRLEQRSLEDVFVSLTSGAMEDSDLPGEPTLVMSTPQIPHLDLKEGDGPSAKPAAEEGTPDA